MELIKLIILLALIGYANEYVMNWHFDRQFEINRKADLMELEKQGRLKER